MCLEKDLDFTLSCNHQFHRCCLLRWCSTKFTHGVINCPNCRKEIDMKLLLPDKARVDNIKELGLLTLNRFLNIVKKNKGLFNIHDKYHLEEIEVFAPMIYVYITDPGKFYNIMELLIDVKIKNSRFKIQKEIEGGVSKRIVDIGDGVPRRLL